MNDTSNPVLLILLFLALIIVSYFGWKFERHINYKYSYQEQVQSEVKKQVDARFGKMEEQIKQLQMEISQLKTNHIHENLRRTERQI